MALYQRVAYIHADAIHCEFQRVTMRSRPHEKQTSNAKKTKGTLHFRNYSCCCRLSELFEAPMCYHLAQHAVIILACLFLMTARTECNAHGKTGRPLLLKGDLVGEEAKHPRYDGRSNRALRTDFHGDAAGIPCVYEGHVETDRNWHGYLANVSVRTTGQLSFEFAYPAGMCCLNVLFYLEDQMAVISRRMNCWQKEYLLRPEEDQILRLTPSFSWSGCHVTNHDGIDTFVCKGGRSFSVDAIGDRLTTWYIAISNCASQVGIDLYYHLEIYGHIGECVRMPSHTATIINSGNRPAVGNNNPPVPKASLMPREAGNTRQVSSAKPCVLQGNVTSTNPWFGFLRNISLATGGGYRYQFTYPLDLHTQNIILYSEEDILKLDWELSCWQKEAIIGQLQLVDQIIEMHNRASWNGCTVPIDNTSQHLVCRGERRYESPRKIFMALSNCRSNHGVQIQYQLEVYGLANDSLALCSGVSRTATVDLGVTVRIFLLGIFFVGVTSGENVDISCTPALVTGSICVVVVKHLKVFYARLKALIILSNVKYLLVLLTRVSGYSKMLRERIWIRERRLRLYLFRLIGCLKDRYCGATTQYLSSCVVVVVAVVVHIDDVLCSRCSFALLQRIFRFGSVLNTFTVVIRSCSESIHSIVFKRHQKGLFKILWMFDRER